jgi:predicted Zn-dependent protease
MAFVVFIALISLKSATLANGKIPLLGAAVLVLALSVATFQRNQIWSTSVRLWADVARKSPGKHRPWYNLGTHLMTDSGKPDEAIPALLNAIALDPQHADTWHNLGSSYLLSNRAKEALGPLRTAVRLKPDLANAVVNLAVALIHNGKPVEAVQHLEGVRQRLPNWPEVRLNLGIAYVGMGNLTDARGELAALQRLAPHLAPALVDQIQRASVTTPAKQ